MKFLECYVENFGRLSGFSYRFEDGMNSLLHENGWGKTTFSAFLKAMLYGIGSTRSTDLSLNERLRYTPWQGGRFGGNLTFKTDKGTYRVERTFGAKEGQDTFTLYNAMTGQLSQDYSTKLGEEIFGIDAAGYERSTFISEKMTSDSGGKDYTGIQSRLVDMNDLSDYEIACKKLDKRRHYYFVQGGRGMIAETERTLTARKTELLECEEALKQTNQLGRRAHELDAKREALEAQAVALRRNLDASVTVRENRALEAHKNDLISNVERTREQVAACRAYLSGNVPSITDTEEKMRTWNALSSRQRPEQAVKLPALLLPILLACLGLAAIIAGIVLSSTSPILPYIGGIIGAVLLAGSGCTLYLRRRAADTLSGVKAAQFDYDRQLKEIDTFLSAFPLLEAELGMKDKGEMLWAVRNKLEELRRRTEEQAEAEAALTSFRSAHPYLFDGTTPVQSEDDLQNKASLDALLLQIDAVRRDRMACEREMATYSASAARYTSCAQEILSLEEKIATYKKSLDIIQTTEQLLSRARANLTTRYLGDVQHRFRHYMKLLTATEKGTLFSDEYETESFTVTPDFQVNISKFAQTHSAASLSRGGRDVVTLCLRFAICDALFGDTEPPLILDDPFINLDDEKTAAAMNLLKEIAKERQIIYVACHSSRI